MPQYDESVLVCIVRVAIVGYCLVICMQFQSVHPSMR